MGNFKFSSISQNLVDAEKYSVYEKKTEHYVRWGHRNNFPNYLIELYHNSSIHATCVNAITEAIVGQGLISNNNTVLDKANLDNESWNEIFAKVALDYYLFGGFALEIIWSKDRKSIAEVYHIDFSYLRAKEKDYRGKIPGYYISDEWDKMQYVKNLDNIPYLPVFNPSKNKDETNQLYLHQPYTPGSKYYPIPLYQGAIKVIDLDSEIDTFHLANIKNGLAPSLAITTFTNGTEDEREQIERMLQSQYSGAEKAGRMLYMDVASREEMPEIKTIDLNVADGYYSELNESTTQKILTAHRITSPMMLGIKTAGQLGGREEVENAYLLFLNTVIKPLQQDILDCLNYIMDYNYPGTELGVIQTNLFENNAEEDAVVTGTDAEVGEDDALEQQIEDADINNLINTPNEYSSFNK